MLSVSGVSAADMTEEQQIQKARETVMDAQSGHTAAFSEGVALVQTLQDTQQAVDAQLNNSTMLGARHTGIKLDSVEPMIDALEPIDVSDRSREICFLGESSERVEYFSWHD